MATSITSPPTADLSSAGLHTLRYDSILADACAFNRRISTDRKGRPQFFDIATQITQRPAPWLHRGSQSRLRRPTVSESQFVLVYRRHRWLIQSKKCSSKQRRRLIDGISLDSPHLLFMFQPLQISNTPKAASNEMAGTRSLTKALSFADIGNKQIITNSCTSFDLETSLHGSASGDGSCLSSATQNSTSNSTGNSSLLERRYSTTGEQISSSKYMSDVGIVSGARRIDSLPSLHHHFPQLQQQHQLDAHIAAVDDHRLKMHHNIEQTHRSRGEQGVKLSCGVYDATGNGKSKIPKKKNGLEKGSRKHYKKYGAEYGVASAELSGVRGGRRGLRLRPDTFRWNEAADVVNFGDGELENDSEELCTLPDEAIYRSNATLPSHECLRRSPSSLLHAGLDCGSGPKDLRGQAGVVDSTSRFPSADQMTTSQQRCPPSPCMSDSSSIDGVRWKTNSADCHTNFSKVSSSHFNAKSTNATSTSGLQCTSLEIAPCSIANGSTASPMSSSGRSLTSGNQLGCLNYTSSPRLNSPAACTSVQQQLQIPNSAATINQKKTTETGCIGSASPIHLSGVQQSAGGGSVAIAGAGELTSNESTTVVTFFVCEVCASRYRSTAGLRYHYHSQHAGYTPRNPISASASRITIPMHEYSRYGPATGLRGGRNSRSKRSRCGNNYVCFRGVSSSPSKGRITPTSSQRNVSENPSLSDPDMYQLPSDSASDDTRQRSLYSSVSEVQRGTEDSSSYLSALKLNHSSSELEYGRKQSPSFAQNQQSLTLDSSGSSVKTISYSSQSQHFASSPNIGTASSALASMDHMASSLLQQEQQQQSQSSAAILTQLHSSTASAGTYQTTFSKATSQSEAFSSNRAHGFCASGGSVGGYGGQDFFLESQIPPTSFNSGPPLPGGFMQSPYGPPPPLVSPIPAQQRGSFGLQWSGGFLETRNMLRQRRLQCPMTMFTPGDGGVICGYCLSHLEAADMETYSRCFGCGLCAHVDCILPARSIASSVRSMGRVGNPLLCYPWLCTECKTCWICGSGLNEENLVVCSECDRGFHAYCLASVAGSCRGPLNYPENWICEVCQQQYQHHHRQQPGVCHTIHP